MYMYVIYHLHACGIIKQCRLCNPLGNPLCIVYVYV